MGSGSACQDMGSTCSRPPPERDRHYHQRERERERERETPPHALKSIFEYEPAPSFSKTDQLGGFVLETQYAA